MKQNFPTINALAIAVAAYHWNKSTIVRNTTVDEYGQEVIPNRQLIAEHLEGRRDIFRINDHYIAQAEGIITYLQQTVIMQSLRNTPDRFLAQIAELLSKQDVTVKDVGILAWAPKIADDYQKKDHVREISSRYEHSSRYVGRVGDKIETGFTLIEKRYVKSMDCYAVYGCDDHGNCLFYWAKTLDKVCEVGRIHGRIKAQQQDEYRNNARVTTLNYVKVL
jgi:hypothetical protein